MQTITKLRPEARTDVWTPKLVRKALISAFRVLEVTAGRVGHKKLRSGAPAYLYSGSDLSEQLLTEVAAQQKGETTMRMRLRAKIQPSSRDISHMNSVLINEGAWLVGPVTAYPDHLKMLIAASMAKARNKSDRQLCRDRGWHLTTFQRHRDFAAGVIAKELNRRGARTW